VKNIKFYNLSILNKKYEKYFISSFKKINNNGRYIIGSYVKKFEKKLSNFCNSRYAVGVGNCVDAIKLSFMTLKIVGNLKDGDEVLVPANTYVASIIGILSANLVPKIVDINSSTFNINVSQIEESITKKTKAILVVELYGHPSEVDVINKIAKKYKLQVVLDAAQSLGASYKKKNVGSYFDLTCFSFFPGKNLGAFGDAGAIVTKSKKNYEILNSLRNYGEKPFSDLKDRKYINNYIGVNSRLDEIQASVLLRKLKNFKRDQANREKIANFYNKNIINKLLIKPVQLKHTNHAWHLYVVKCKYRNKLKKYLKKNGIETMIHYPRPFYKQPAFSQFIFDKTPTTDKIYNEILSIPLHPNLKKKEIQYIVKIINEFK